MQVTIKYLEAEYLKTIIEINNKIIKEHNANDTRESSL